MNASEPEWSNQRQEDSQGISAGEKITYIHMEMIWNVIQSWPIACIHVNWSSIEMSCSCMTYSRYGWNNTRSLVALWWVSLLWFWTLRSMISSAIWDYNSTSEWLLIIAQKANPSAIMPFMSVINSKLYEKKHVNHKLCQVDSTRW